MSVASLASMETRRAHVRAGRAAVWGSGASLWGRATALSGAAAIVSFPLLQPSGPGNTSIPDAFAMLTVLTSLAWSYSSRNEMRVPYLLPVSLMMVAGALAALAGSYPDIALVSLSQDAFLLAWSAAIVGICRTPSGLAIVMRTWVYSGVFWAVILIVTVVGQVDIVAGITARTGSRAALTFGDPNLAAGYFDLCLMMVWATARPRRRSLRWLAYIALLAAIVLTGSNGFSLGLAAAVVVAGTIGVCRRRGVPAGMAALCGAVLLFGVVISQVNINTVVQDAAASSTVLRDYIGRGEQSAQGRDALLQETLDLAAQGGVIGIGPGAVKPTLTAQDAPVAFEAHSDYTASLAERGLLGALGLAGLIGALIWYARGALAPLGRDVAAVVVHPGALVGALVTMAIGAGVYEVLHFRHLWALFGVVAAVGIAGRRARA
jgi:hypothetical protein